MFDFLARPLSGLLAFFYNIVPNYALGIVLLTIVVMVVLTPFTVKSTRSMLAMQRLQPEIKRLQQQHKNDRQALNEAMMAFYKEHGVNPLGGCLPMLLQMPAFFGLYQAIRGLTRNPPHNLSHSSKLFRALCPGYADHLCQGSKTFVVSIKSFGFDLAKAATDRHGPFSKALPFYTLIALTTATQYYQQRQLSNRNPQAAAANPQMQTMQKIFPLVFLVIYVRIPAAVVMYFLVSNVLRIAQQGAMWRWDPKLVAEVASDVRQVEAKTDAIEARSRAVSNKARAGRKRRVRPDKGEGTVVEGAKAKANGSKPTATPPARPGSGRVGQGRGKAAPGKSAPGKSAPGKSGSGKPVPGKSAPGRSGPGKAGAVNAGPGPGKRSAQGPKSNPAPGTGPLVTRAEPSGFRATRWS